MNMSLKDYIFEHKKQYLSELLLETDGDYQQAAKIAKISRASLFRYYNRHELSKKVRLKMLTDVRLEKFIKSHPNIFSPKTKCSSLTIKKQNNLKNNDITKFISRNELENGNKYLNILTNKIVTVTQVDFSNEQITFKTKWRQKTTRIKQFIIEHRKIT